MDIVEAIKSRKSIRGFKPEPVGKETLKEILDVACRAPSALNTQPWEFFVLAGIASHDHEGSRRELERLIREETLRVDRLPADRREDEHAFPEARTLPALFSQLSRIHVSLPPRGSLFVGIVLLLDLRLR